MVTKIKFFVILLVSSFGFSQNYGYLVETEVLGAFHANGGDLSINSDAGNVGSVNFFATQNNIGSVAFEFLDVPNNFTTISMVFNAEAVAIGSFPDCSSTRNFNTTIQNFNTNSNISFSGCNFSLRVYPLHIEEPNASNSTLCLSTYPTARV